MARKKKLLYIMRYRLDESFNLKAKFDGQLNAFKNLGFDVSCIAFDSTSFYVISGDKKEVVGKTHFGFPSYIHTLFYYDLHKIVLNLLKKQKFDYVYWRSGPCWLSSCRIAGYISKSETKLIYEYPTFPVKREKQFSFLRQLFLHYSDWLQRYVDKRVDLFVMIGEDAGGSYKGIPAINITNGIDIGSIKPRKRNIDKDTIHILALASMSYWHGYDRLIKSLAEYKGTQSIVVHMVGGNDGGALGEWKELTKSLGIEEKVIFHGAKSGTELDEMFNTCDVGVNSLGMYRKGFAVTSELKSREYAARGLPFVCSVEDPALAGATEPLWHQISNDDTIPDMEEIVAFALRMRKDAGCVDKLRAYAAEHMTWDSQYIRVFERLEGEQQ
ncbi:MAG: glycosyltransferase family 4 protein [Ruminococcaceae bacterium]|nr:glycosyltransferase family 4 protein [Oscillospiraceae bacterium]